MLGSDLRGTEFDLNVGTFCFKLPWKEGRTAAVEKLSRHQTMEESAVPPTQTAAEATASWLKERGISLSDSSIHGNGLFADKQFEVGSLICERMPLAWCLASGEAKQRCAFCALSVSNNPQCSVCMRCRTHFYCKRACQRSIEFIHRRECALLKACKDRAKEHKELAKEWGITSIDVLQLALRVIACLDNDGEENSTLEWHLKETPVVRMSDPRNMKVEIELARALSSLRIKKDPQWIKRLVQTVTAGLFVFPDEHHQPYALVWCKVLAMLNHSCTPNAWVVFNGENRTTAIRAIKPIAPGEEILVSYFLPQLALTNHQQQIALENNYRFRCYAPCCGKQGPGLSPTQGDDVDCSSSEASSALVSSASGMSLSTRNTTTSSSTWTSGRSGGGSSATGGLSVEDAVEENLAKDDVDRLREAERLLTEGRQKLREGIYSNAEQYFKAAVGICNNVPSSQLNAYSIIASNELLRVFFAKQNWAEETQKIAKEMLGAVRRQFPDSHPAVALQYYRLGVIQMERMETEEAWESLQKAERILAVALGTRHPTVKDIRKRQADLATVEVEDPEEETKGQRRKRMQKLRAQLREAGLRVDHSTYQPHGKVGADDLLDDDSDFVIDAPPGQQPPEAAYCDEPHDGYHHHPPYHHPGRSHHHHRGGGAAGAAGPGAYGGGGGRGGGGGMHGSLKGGGDARGGGNYPRVGAGAGVGRYQEVTVHGRHNPPIEDFYDDYDYY